MKKKNKKQRDHMFIGQELERQKKRLLEKYEQMDSKNVKKEELGKGRIQAE